MPRVLTIVSLILIIAAEPMAAQEVYEIPFALELQGAPIVLDLDDASLDVVLDPDSAPVLRALGLTDRQSSGAALAVTSDGSALVVRRPVSDSESIPPRLRLELVLNREQRLQVVGSDLEVVVEGLPLKVGGGKEDDDEDDIDPDEDNETDEEGDDEGEEGVKKIEEGGKEATPIELAQPYLLILDVAGSSINMIDVVSASVTAFESFVRTVGTRSQLNLSLEGGTTEVEGHQGVIEVTAHDNELVLNNTLGRITPTISGGSMIARSGVGPIQGRFDDALVRIESWRGPVIIEGSGATIETRTLSNVRLEIKGEGHEVAVEGFRGSLIADLGGGSLSARQLKGLATIMARAGTEITLDDFAGKPTLTLENSTARLVDVVGLVTAEISGGSLEVDGARQLDLVAADCEVVVGRLGHLIKAEVTDSQLDFDLWELSSNPTLILKGSTEARVRLRMPCSVKLGEVQLLGGGADVTGCDLHSQTVRRTRYDRLGVDGNRHVRLDATLGEDSTLEVEGVP